jgi:hypothetical protein
METMFSDSHSLLMLKTAARHRPLAPQSARAETIFESTNRLKRICWEEEPIKTLLNDAGLCGAE